MAGGAGLKWNAMFDGRSLAGFCEAARVRGVIVFRVAHSIRPEGATVADAQLRAHAAATADRIRECCFDGRLRPRALRADGCGRRASAAAFLPPARELAGVGVSTL
jgi:hypothetical protein